MRVLQQPGRDGARRGAVGGEGGVNGIGRRGGTHRACEEESPATDREAMGDDGLDLVLRV